MIQYFLNLPHTGEEVHMLPMTDIHVRSFSGASVKPYIHRIIKLRHEVYRDSPYFEKLDPEEELAYLKKIASCKESISVLIFNYTTLIGVSFGYPFTLEDPSLHKDFIENGLDIHNYYFFGPSVLLKAFQNRGMGHHFFDARESFVSQLGQFKEICFSSPEAIEHPTTTLSLYDFLRKRGYSHHPQIQAVAKRHKINQEAPQETSLHFWTKEIAQPQLASPK